MKVALTLFALFAALPFASHAEELSKKTHFVCGAAGSGTMLSLQIGGARYGDQVQFELRDQDVRELLLSSEAATPVTFAKIHGFLQFGTCTVGSGDVLVTCPSPLRSFKLLYLNFERTEEFAPGFQQTANISRLLEVKNLEATVTKVGTDAHLRLQFTVTTPEAFAKNIVIERKLATLNQDWYQCKYIGVP